MTEVYRGIQAQLELYLGAPTDYAGRLDHRIEKLSQQARLSQLSAAESMERVAAAHNQVASAYWRLVEYSLDDDDAASRWQHVAIHRAFARKDRRMAAQLREMAGT